MVAEVLTASLHPVSLQSLLTVMSTFIIVVTTSTSVHEEGFNVYVTPQECVDSLVNQKKHYGQERRKTRNLFVDLR